jgi:hypothetical protein
MRYDDSERLDDLQADGREVPPMCEAITERRTIIGKEITFVCGGEPDYNCHNPQCLKPVCGKHTIICDECGDDFHQDCLGVVNGRFVCAACQFTHGIMDQEYTRVAA